jgi:SnoaL-like protein
MDEATTRAMLTQFYETTADDVTGASEIYSDDAVLEFPQGKERIRGKANIIAFRSAYPADVTIEVHRITGRQDLWVNELILRYDGNR